MLDLRGGSSANACLTIHDPSRKSEILTLLKIFSKLSLAAPNPDERGIVGLVLVLSFLFLP
jgi:hypothetical protein